ncbi:unnamed protein product [Calypogeia fissa]
MLYWWNVFLLIPDVFRRMPWRALFGLDGVFSSEMEPGVSCLSRSGFTCSSLTYLECQDFFQGLRLEK